MFGDGKKLTITQDKPDIDVISEAEAKPKLVVAKH
jgi:hypothetical protein